MSERPKRGESESALGLRIRALRAARGWTLEQTGQASGLARSTLSKIENGQVSPTYDALIKLAAGLEIDLGELFAPPKPAPTAGAGRLSIDRAGAGTPHVTPQYAHVLLCNGLSRKDMVPFRTTITARRFEDFDDWSRHVGEEFVYVLSGRVRLFTEFYEPADLKPGDCWYVDSRMGHRVISVGRADAVVLWMSTTHPRAETGPG